MNTSKKMNFFKFSTITLLFISVSMISCSTKNKSEENTSKSSSTQVETPKMDLFTAILTNDIDVLKQHIASGSNLNEKDPYGGSSPLITAALFGKTEAVTLLLDANVDINFTNNDGSTALHTAAFFCRKDIVELLLKKNADKTIKNNFGSTAYESVAGPYSDVKQVYEMMESMLSPMGLQLDYAQLEADRPVIANLLK